ncbi:MAG: 2'-5' RNA ligase family protein [bacterium]|nr:2'-5' RNA ligase family protein [bacterium]
MRFLITLKMPQVVVQKMDTYKEKYFPAGFYKIESHITLRPPFDLALEREDLYEGLEDSIKLFKPMKLIVGGMDTFQNRVLFLKKKAPEELGELFRGIKDLVNFKFKRDSSLKKDRGGDEYNPHATISVASPKKIAKFQDELDGERFEMEFLVDGINLYVWHKDKWTFDRDITFGG